MIYNTYSHTDDCPYNIDIIFESGKPIFSIQYVPKGHYVEVDYDKIEYILGEQATEHLVEAAWEDGLLDNSINPDTGSTIFD